MSGLFIKHPDIAIHESDFFSWIRMEKDSELNDREDNGKCYLVPGILIEYVKYAQSLHDEQVLSEQQFASQLEQKEMEEWGLSKVVESHMDELQNSITVKDKVSVNPLSLTTAIELVTEYELNISKQVLDWKKNKDKTGCAVFCNYLYDRKLFEPNKIETAILFAKKKYGIDIEVMIYKIRKTKEKAKLESKTDQMIRLILNKPFGKL